MVTSERSAKSMTFAVTQPGLRCNRRFGDFNTISVGGFSQQYWMLQYAPVLQDAPGFCRLSTRLESTEKWETSTHSPRLQRRSGGNRSRLRRVDSFHDGFPKAVDKVVRLLQPEAQGAKPQTKKTGNGLRASHISGCRRIRSAARRCETSKASQKRDARLCGNGCNRASTFVGTFESDSSPARNNKTLHHSCVEARFSSCFGGSEAGLGVPAPAAAARKNSRRTGASTRSGVRKSPAERGGHRRMRQAAKRLGCLDRALGR